MDIYSAEHVDIGVVGSGLEFEIMWSEDETVVDLSFTRKDAHHVKVKTIKMSALELENLLHFLVDRMQ